MYKNIILMTDFSKDSDYATKIACEITRTFSSNLNILHVGYMDPGFTVLLDDEDVDKVKKRMDENVEKEFEKLEERVPCLKDVDYETIYHRGVPYEEGLKEIETGKYDLLVLGSHGKNSIKKFFYGSTTAKLTRRSPISTLITRATKE